MVGSSTSARHADPQLPVRVAHDELRAWVVQAQQQAVAAAQDAQSEE